MSGRGGGGGGAIWSLDSYLDGRERGEERVKVERVDEESRQVKGARRGKERGLTLLALPYTYGSTFSPSPLY